MSNRKITELPCQETKIIDTKALTDLAIYLSGVKDGRGGNLLPLGTIVLDELWNAISYMHGDVRFKAERDQIK